MKSKKHTRQRGFTLVEVLMAAVMLGAVSMGTVTMLKYVYDNTAAMELDTIADNLLKSRIMFIYQNQGNFVAGCNPLNSMRNGLTVGVSAGEWVTDGTQMIKGRTFCALSAVVTAVPPGGTICAFNPAIDATCAQLDPVGLDLSAEFISPPYFLRAEESYAMVKVLYRDFNTSMNKPMSVFPEAFAASELPSDIKVKIKIVPLY